MAPFGRIFCIILSLVIAPDLVLAQSLFSPLFQKDNTPDNVSAISNRLAAQQAQQQLQEAEAASRIQAQQAYTDNLNARTESERRSYESNYDVNNAAYLRTIQELKSGK